ncbi:MAG: ABC transporter permease [Waddliaceae bacterium]
MNHHEPPKPLIHVIEATNGWRFLHFQELWKYRELFYFLSLRDVLVRYKQTLFGVLWALLQPLISVLIFTLLFSRLVNTPLNNVNYPVFVLSGWLPWMFFFNGVTNSSSSLVTDANLLKKVYFPRLIVPISKICAGFVDFFITLGFLFLMMLYHNYSLGIELMILPFAVVYLFMVTSAIGIWLSAINAVFRDVRHAVPFFLQMWFFVTPVIYPMSVLSSKWQMVYCLNPMNGVVKVFRWILLRRYLDFPHLLSEVAISALVGLVLFVFGAFYFRRMEKLFADVV